MSDRIRAIDQDTPFEQTGLDSPPDQRVSSEQTNTGLALRFLIGLLSMGGDEATRRLREMQGRLDADPTLWRPGVPAGDKTLRRQAWYMSLGLLRHGQRRLQEGIHKGYDLSLRAAGRVSSASDRLDLSRLARPVRKPLEIRLARWREQAALIVQEGELEDQASRALATGTLTTLILEILDEVAKNPEMQDFVQDLIGQQGVGMATSIADNARAVTLTADDASDALLRWLLRRTPRRELPPSPVEGQPQTMYAPTARVEKGKSNGG
jgi:hypothetical protein